MQHVLAYWQRIRLTEGENSGKVQRSRIVACSWNTADYISLTRHETPTAKVKENGVTENKTVVY